MDVMLSQIKHSHLMICYCTLKLRFSFTWAYISAACKLMWLLNSRMSFKLLVDERNGEKYIFLYLSCEALKKIEHVEENCTETWNCDVKIGKTNCGKSCELGWIWYIICHFDK